MSDSMPTMLTLEAIVEIMAELEQYGDRLIKPQAEVRDAQAEVDLRRAALEKWSRVKLKTHKWLPKWQRSRN